MADTSKVTRLEVIDHREGVKVPKVRAFHAMPCKVDLSLQDEGRTLKVFVTDANPVPKQGK